MARKWRCLIGRHDWHEVKTPDGHKYAECTRCGMRDWQRLNPTKWPPPGERHSGGGWPRP
jgi:hypothetical protein